MQGELYKDINQNKYYLIDNIGAYNYIVIQFETFKSLFISIDTFQKNMIKIEFNLDNVKILLDTYELFKGRINYNYFNTNDYIVYNNKMLSIKNWVDVFNFVNKYI